METKIRCGTCGFTIGLTETMINAIKNNPEEAKKIATAGLELAKSIGDGVYNIYSFIESTYTHFMATRGFIDNSLESIANISAFACPSCKTIGCWVAYSKFSAPLTMSIGQLEHLMSLLHTLMGETLEQLARLEEQLIEKDNESGVTERDLIVGRKSLWGKVIDLNNRLELMETSWVDLLQKLNIAGHAVSEWNPWEIYVTLVNENAVASIIVDKKLRIELAGVLKNLAKVEKDFARIVEFVKKAEFEEDDKEAKDAKQADYRTTMNERVFCHIHLMVIKNQCEELKSNMGNFKASA